MSYDINLADEMGIICTVESHQEGATYVLSGTNQASLNITYNYAPFFYEFLDNEKGMGWLYGKKGEECVTRLEGTIKLLGAKRNDNYWDATAGNVGYVLSILLSWAKEYPNGRFEGD